MATKKGVKRTVKKSKGSSVNSNKKEIKVAIVGSHVDSVTSISNYLEAKGIKTFWAYLGTEAISICQVNNVNLLVMDATMSGMGAFEVARLAPNIKIIVMSALDDLGTFSGQFKNVVAIIKKPVDNEDLLKLVRKHP